MPSVFTPIKTAWTSLRRYFRAGSEPAGSGYAGGPFSDSFGDRVPRLVRYAVYWGAFENTLLCGGDREQAAWAQEFMRAAGLYQFTRGILNPTARIVEFHVSHVWGGQLDPAAGDGKETPSALPIALDEEFAGNETALRSAIARLWRDSAWQREKDTVVRQGAAKGDVFLTVIDSPDAGDVRIGWVPADEIAWVSKDSKGTIRGYVREYYRDDPDAPKWSIRDIDRTVPKVLYTETAELDGDSVDVVYRTYKGADRQPYGWHGQPAEWRVPYGFVPLWHVEHIPSGKGWGWPEVFSALIKFCEDDEQASKGNDSLRRSLEAGWFFPGMDGRDYDTAVAAFRNSDWSSESGRQAARNEQMVLFAKSPDAKAQPLIVEVDLGQVTESLRYLTEEHRMDFPELRYELAQADANAAALREARKPVETKIGQRRTNYDDAGTRAMQAALAIGGWRYAMSRGDRRLEHFKGFGLESYDRNQLAFHVGDRPVFGVTPADRAEEDSLVAGQVKAWRDAGLPFEMALKRAGFDDATIADAVAGQQAEADAALEQAQQMADIAGGGEDEGEQDTGGGGMSEVYAPGVKVLLRGTRKTGVVVSCDYVGSHDVAFDDGSHAECDGDSLIAVVPIRSQPIAPAFPIGSVVYLRMAQERRPGLVTMYQVSPDDIVYSVAWGNATDSRHYAIELTTEYTPDYSGD